MSVLDRHFAHVASKGLPVEQQPVPGESTLEPGWVYRVEAANQSAIFAVADHHVADVVGKRIALKIVSAAGEPGALSIVAPPDQLIEGDDGWLGNNVFIGFQDLGAYREWICDPDGNWLMVARVPPTSDAPPLGQIVIQGVPVVIQGTPLVNTVPPADPIVSAPVPVTVASPPIVVPHAPVIRPRATTVELEDTFADASLEMDAAGEKFRVAAALQELIEDRVVLDFTLRATSVSSTDYEEIGVQRFDPAGFEGRTLRLVAELDVAAFGQVAELQLVDLNTGTEVATLATDKTATTPCAVALVLPTEVTLYSVRLRRVGGNASLRVACRSVAMELTNA